MAKKIARVVLIGNLIFLLTIASAQEKVPDIVHRALISYQGKNYLQAVRQLNEAILLIQQDLQQKMNRCFPEELKDWRSDESELQSSSIGIATDIAIRKSYFKKGGGKSVDIKIELSPTKVANIRMMFVNPSQVKRAGNTMKLDQVADQKCLSSHDRIDRYARLIFIPSSSVKVTIIGYDMNDLKTVTRFAGKMDWSYIQRTFP